jgi:hypothetical protein
VKLPDFLTLKGSLGNPKSEINYLKLAATAAQSAAGLTAGNTNLHQASGLLDALGGFLGGTRSQSTNAAAGDTNAAPTSARTNLLDLLTKPRGN